LLAKAAQYDELWYKKVANRYSAVFDPALNLDQVELVVPDLDDRLVFMETNPGHQLTGAAALAAASRVLKDYDAGLAKECLEVAEALWQDNKDAEFEGRWGNMSKLQVLVELIIATGKDEYKDALCAMDDMVSKAFGWSGWTLGRVMQHIECEAFKDSVMEAARVFKPQLDKMLKTSPFGSTLSHTEYIAFQQYYLHKNFPEIYSDEYLFSVINYLLGCRPGTTTNSLVSGVGANSPTVAYGTNRADWSYIPGGTFWNAVNLVSPDFAEDKVWPYLWQEREYIITSPCYFMFSVLAADRILEEK